MKYILLFLAVFASSLATAQEYRTHKVKPGEAVKAIAKKYNVQPERIYSLNPDVTKGKKLTASLLVIPYGETPDGQKGSGTVHFKEYEVPAKQTLYSLAKENNISLKDLKKFNPYLYDQELGEGDRIRIPIFASKKVPNYNESLSQSTFKNLRHIVLPKQTKFGISKQYQMSVEELEKMNPGLDTTTIKPGQILKVSNPIDDSQRAENVDIIEVEPKETFYSLTRRLGISRDSLEMLNPNLKKRGLEAGMKLTVPKKKGLLRKNRPQNQIVDLTKRLENRQRKNIKVLLPFKLNTVTEDTTREAQLKKDRVMQISLDFYSGVMAALDTVQKAGIPVDAEIVDTQNSTEHLKSILQHKDWSKTQAVIGPLLANNLQLVSQYLSGQNIPVVSPLTSNNLNGMKNILQSRPPKLVQQKTLFSYIDSLKTDKNLILVKDDKNSDLAEKIHFNFPTIKTVKQSKKEYIKSSDFASLLSDDRENWVIFAAEDVGLITNSISHLKKLSENHNIRVFSTEKNSVFSEEVPSASLEQLKFTYPAFSLDREIEGSSSFFQAYKDKYGILPSKIAIRGFDLTKDIIFRLSLNDGFYAILKNDIFLTQYLENSFRYIENKENNFVNEAAYLIQYDKNLKLKVLNR